ncbi:hypothetical protein PspKH34_25120 [Parageobacillus sp. KH3-4]|nr:hypothetical protein PspKH34_25120 [Parageobacillus sp. KH3-4]
MGKNLKHGIILYTIKEVTWTGIIADLETITDSIVVYGKEDGYNGENWITINHEEIKN